ncbi:response regulator [Azospirillum sp.]|uniref:response regulator n=1 Tax=Azospirillum sp. TaxID=34012 RepID=UPI002602E916|nr:response regulator [Azospirillum sp.]
MASDTSPPPDDLDLDCATETVECREPADFYAPAARDSVGRFCRRFLDENTLTATELLHNNRHQNALSNTPTFVAILAQAERALERKGALTPLVNELARLTRERAKDTPPPELTPSSYAATAATLLTKGGFLGRFLLDAALAQHVIAERGFADKAKALLALAEATEDSEALAPIERLLGEIFASDAGTASCAQDSAFPALIDLIVTLVAADRPMPDTAPPIFRRLAALMGRSAMPGLREALTAAFRREMSKPSFFTIASAGDMHGIDAVQREILALSDLSARLRLSESGANGAYHGGAKTENALQRRTAILVNEDTVPEITKGRNLAQKLRILFILQKMPLSPSAARAVNDYLKSFFDSRDFPGRILDCWKERGEKLKGLAEVQGMVLTSAFSAEDREWIAGQVDDIQNAYLRTQRVLAPLLQTKEDPHPDAVLEIVRLAGEGAFCKGKSRMAVARALYRQTHRVRFVRGFLLNASSSKERLARAEWLRKSLAVVGVPFLDLANQRVLAVDDEEGPRNFVTSVLRDLGVGHIDTACDGQEALDRLTGPGGGDYNLIICDWMMPKRSGLDVLKRVRAIRADVPFLMVTALATLEAVKHALAHHVSGYIAKPFTPDQLEEKIFLVLAQSGMVE